MKNSTYIIKPLLFNLDKALDTSSFIALIVLFFTETSYYLLILQTGVVELYNSDITQIWTTPLFGIIGMLVALKLEYRQCIPYRYCRDITYYPRGIGQRDR